MDREDIEAVQKITELTASMILGHINSTLLATFASIGTSLLEKGVMTPADFSVLATRTADMCSQGIGRVEAEGMGGIIDASLRHYVDELLKFAEHGIPGASGAAN